MPGETDENRILKARERALMAINIHAHLGGGQDVDERVAHYRHPEITHTVLFGDDDKVAEAMRKYPDFVVGFGTIRHGVPATAEKIREFGDRGFRGVKVIGLRRPYDDPELFGMYEAMVEHGLPVLFHTGFLALHPGRGEDGSFESMLFMRPGRLDTLGRAFPDLVMIGAHLGAPWCAEACSVAWKHRNAYFDLSGGTVKMYPLAWFRHHFMRASGGGFLREEGRTPNLEILTKLVFGTDNPAPETMLEFYHNFCERMGLDEPTRQAIMTGNAAKILGVDGGDAPETHG